VTAASALHFHAIAGLPEFKAGDDLVGALGTALARPPNPVLANGDVLVVTQKIISKIEDRYVGLATIEPGAEATRLARQCGKDPRLVELVLRESSAVLRVAPNVLIVRHRLGFVVANAAIDQSNIAASGEAALLLPLDPDASAAGLREAFARQGLDVGVLISDSFGRAWRMGVTGTCIGSAGVVALHDRRGERDRAGRLLQVTQVAVADQLCASAALVGGEGAEGTPVVLVRGLDARLLGGTQRAADLLRPHDQDLFQ